MAKRKNQEMDFVYVLKLILYLIIGAQWMKIQTKNNIEIPVPVGALIGLVFAAHEHFQIDRKIEYAILLVAMFIGYLVPLGVILTFS